MDSKKNKTNPIIEEAQQLKQAGRAELVNLESFLKALNKKPAMVRKNRFAGNTDYIPISHIQVMLDQLFFGLWQTRNFTTRLIGNEICGSLELWVFHPVQKDWIVRNGIAATQIRQEKGAAVSDLDSKIKNALEMDYPHLYADCIKSAAKTLGAAFGRDLNRDFVDNYKAFVSQHVQAKAYDIDKVKETIAQINDGPALADYYDSNEMFKLSEEVRKLFRERQKDLMDEDFD